MLNFKGPMHILFYSPGQAATILLEVKNAGVRANSSTTPTVDRIIFPSATTATGYPKPMTAIDTGLYSYTFIVPSQAMGIGSYIVDVSYTDPATSVVFKELYQIVCTAATGSYSVSTQ
jgi:hypothetical protein